MDPSELARRIDVACAYAGIKNRPELAARIGEDGLSSSTLGRIERGERVMEPRSAKAIAEACGVDPRWLLDDDFDPFAPTESVGQLDRIERAISELAITLQADPPAVSPGGAGGRTSPDTPARTGKKDTRIRSPRSGSSESDGQRRADHRGSD